MTMPEQQQLLQCPACKSTIHIETFKLQVLQNPVMSVVVILNQHCACPNPQCRKIYATQLVSMNFKTGLAEVQNTSPSGIIVPNMIMPDMNLKQR